MFRLTEIKFDSKGKTYKGIAEEDFARAVLSDSMGVLVESHRKDYLLW